MQSVKEEEKVLHSAEEEDNAELMELAEMLEPDAEQPEDHDAEDESVQKPDYGAEIIEIIRGRSTPKAMKEQLEDYHGNDIAVILPDITATERKKLYRILDTDMLSDVFSYAETEDVSRYLNEMDIKKAASILSAMETDAAVEILRSIDKEKRILIIELLDEESRQDIALIASFDEDEIGSKMTTNFILIRDGLSVKEAMRELVEQAEKNDNISTIFVVDAAGLFVGAIDLKELIIAREGTPLSDIIMTSFPYVYGQETVDECIERLKDYSENSIPVLDNSNRVLGVITSQSIVEVVDEEMGEDYAKFAGLTSEEDLNEPVIMSMRKRLPWLLILMGLGLVISTVVGSFEAIVSTLPIVMAFQSLILDMAGNVGTQSLAVTIRVLTDENLDFRQKLHLVFKEIRVGLCNGLIMGLISFLFIGLYIMLFKGRTAMDSFLISGCCGVSLICAMFIASTTGTLIPMFFKRIKVDPAVASGPLITSLNDLVAVITYYSLCGLFLIRIFGMGA